MTKPFFSFLYAMGTLPGCFLGGSDGDPPGSGLLPIDCSNWDHRMDPRCVRPSSDSVEPGAAGNGPSVKALPGFAVEITSGFIEAGRLVAGVKYGADSDRSGLILAVDLSTGDRTVVSGTYPDPATGPRTTGDGPELGYVNDVERGPDGLYYALNSPTASDETQIVRVDPASGDRTILWEGAIEPHEQCNASSNGAPRIPTPWNLAVGPDGTFYLGVSNNPVATGVGIIAVTATGSTSTCRIVSLSGSADARGAGPELDEGQYNALTMGDDGMLYALLGLDEVLVRFDLDSGDRMVVSGGGVGSGPDLGVQSLAFDARLGRFWTAGGFASARLGGAVLVDRVSGDRELFGYSAGPASRSTEGSVWPMPDSELLLTVQDGYALVLVDPTTGNSNLFSI